MDEDTNTPLSLSIGTVAPSFKGYIFCPVPEMKFCACGEGTLDIERYARLATSESPHMPMIIEHLNTDEEYVASVRYVRRRLS